jgi:hypothetical protein
LRSDLNAAYAKRWRRSRNPFWPRERRRLVEEFEPRVRPFGYSLADVDLEVAESGHLLTALPFDRGDDVG